MMALDFIAAHLDDLAWRTGEHVVLSGAAIAASSLLAVPAGVCLARMPRAAGATLVACSMLQTIPSLALLGFLMALTGQIGWLPSIIALFLYALLPLLRNTIVGLQSTPRPIRHAAEALGMTPNQILWQVSLPLALPMVVAGLRTAAVWTIGTATLCAFIGAGGLGVFINRGIETVDTRLVLLGVVPAAALALLVDAIFAILGRSLAARTKRSSRSKPGWPAKAAVAAGAAAMLAFAADWALAPSAHVVVGCKNFTESRLLAEIIAQTIEREAGLLVERRELGSTSLCWNALRIGAVDVYPEYSGTLLTEILKQPSISDPTAALAAIKASLPADWGIIPGAPFGLNDTYVLAMRRDHASSMNVKRISDLRNHGDLVTGFTSEFIQRADGWKGLSEHYRFTMAHPPVDLAPGHMYQAVRDGQVGLISAFSTDARLLEFDLQPLVDDERFFPSYEAMPLMRSETIRRFPGLQGALDRLAGRIDDGTMMSLNHRVDIDRVPVARVASEFITQSSP